MNTTQLPPLGDNDSWTGPDPAPIEFIPPRASATHRHYPEACHLTIEQLTERLEYWQHRLCLDHWVIELRIVGAGEIPGSGQCETLLTKHRARISLLKHELHPEDCPPYDMEQVLVHELLHIHFAAWDSWTDNDAKTCMSETEEAVCIEQPIERISWVLVELNRAFQANEAQLAIGAAIRHFSGPQHFEPKAHRPCSACSPIPTPTEPSS